MEHLINPKRLICPLHFRPLPTKEEIQRLKEGRSKMERLSIAIQYEELKYEFKVLYN